MTDLFWPPTSEPEPTYSPYPPAPAAPPAPPRTPWWKSTAAAVGATALVFGGVGVGVGAAVVGNDNGNAGLAPSAPASAASLATVPKSYAAIAGRVLPSVVSINVQAVTGSDTGSGVVLRPDGYILTNNHVVSAALDGQGRVSVTFNDGTTSPGRIVGADQQDDLAVVKVTKTGLTPAALGSASAMHVGDPVLALGSPLGLQGSVTAGIISALNRPVATSDSSQQNPFGAPAATTVIDAIQTDAAINPGNSGGPLVNAAGQVVGINSAIASNGGSGNIGVGFAIPIDQARIVAQQLITTGKASHPLMGVSLADATDSAGNPLARVQAVSSGGPAAKAGLRAGDVVVAVGGQNTAGAEAVIAAIRAHQPGDTVRVTVLRDGKRMTLSVTLANATDAQG